MTEDYRKRSGYFLNQSLRMTENREVSGFLAGFICVSPFKDSVLIMTNFPFLVMGFSIQILEKEADFF